jgi:hypothetical protein
MDTETAREHEMDADLGLRTLVTDLEDLVDWTEEAMRPAALPGVRDARGKRWIALGVFGVLMGTVAIAVWRTRER